MRLYNIMREYKQKEKAKNTASIFASIFYSAIDYHV